MRGHPISPYRFWFAAFPPLRRNWRRQAPRLTAVVAAGLMLAGLVAAVPPATAATRPTVPAVPAQKPVPVSVIHGKRVKVPAMTPWRRPATSWPAPGTATVTPGTARAGGTPVSAAVPGSAAPASVRVTVAPRATTAAAGVHGIVFRVAGSGAAGGRVRVSVNYSSFAYAYGGDYASRLRLVELPACALTTPQVPACQTQTALPSANNVQAASVGADVTLGAAAPAVVLAATSTTSGSGGDYTATPLSEAGTWSAGGQSGAFTYSYPISVPPVPGGLQPAVSLDYNSQAVDGLTSSTNNQASWIGGGWDYSPGYIERSYASCENNSTASQKTGDFCWSPNDITTMSLNGQGTTLVQDSSSGNWHPENDNAENISYQTSGPTTNNGTYDNGYWVITQTDGTKYYFGLNELPGYVSGNPVTNSTWTMPVYQPTSGQPCYKATFTDSHCVMAWRWNLDYVTDPHGDAVAYFYNDQTNYYASGNLATTTSTTTANAAYQTGGELSKIEYGLRASAVYGNTPAAQVNFKTATDRTDVPTDLTCANGNSCQEISPTFWTPYRLTTISTQALEGSSLANVDSWALSQSYPSTSDPTSPPSLWLDSIARTGEDGGSLALPPVQFSGQPMPNRVETPTDTSDGYSIITRMRLTSVTNETDGLTTIGYKTPGGACTSGNFPAPDANTLPCFPDYWSPPGATNPVLDWFNKYAVGTITQQDQTGSGLPVTTAYSYNGAAWHYNDDALTRSKQRTWDQWRGYQTVTTESGTAPDPVTKTVCTYFQGMNGDYQSDGSTSSASLTSTRGDVITDSDQYAGLELEKITDNGTSGGEVTDTITLPWSSAATATQTQPSPLPPLRSFLTGTAETKVFTALASGGDRESDTTYTHDSAGRITSASSVPDTTDASEDTCTTTSFPPTTSAGILDLPSEVQVVSVPCGTTPSLPADAVSDTLTFYDRATSLSSDTPTAGNVTQTQLATSYSGSTPVYTTKSRATYDEYGRVLTSSDADNRTTITAYSPATGAGQTQETVTDPAGLVTTTTYDPARNLPLTTTNPAGLTTTEQYDALGRLTAVWTPGNATTGPANYKFAYDVSASAPSSVDTSTLAPDASSYLQGETVYDSLGRVRETQQEMPDGSWNLTDTIYNTLGEQTLTSGPYDTTGITTDPATGVPPGTLVGPAEDLVSSQDGKVYDGDGRVIEDIAYSYGKETWETDTAYGGNYTTRSYQCTSAVASCGGTPQTSFTDGRGLTTAIYQYHAGAPADPSDPASDYDKTSYTYSTARKLATITDAAGNKWSYGYDLAGDETSENDPDAGPTTSNYDAAGQLMSVTDARGKSVSYIYDGDGRKKDEYDTTAGALESTATLLASWTYDTLAKGQLTSSSSYYNGQAYTEAVTGYNAFGEPKASYVTIPAAQGLLKGNYVTQDTYTATGQLASYEDSAAGGLPQETVSYSYNTAGQPTSLNGTWAYTSALTYSIYGQPQRYTLGTTAKPAYVTDSYDPQTKRLSEQQTQTGVTPSVVDDVHYTYDNVGNVVSEADTPAAGPAQAQCFQYDYLGRLTTAWSQGSTGCTAPSGTAEAGAAAPYQDSYLYNTIGNLTSQTSTTPSGQATTTTASYPPTGAAQPHAPTSTQVSGGSAATTTKYVYDPAGHLTSSANTSQSQSLTWDDANRLASLSASGPAGGTATTGYMYDAAGNLLIEQDPGQVTLFLPDEQIVLNTATTTSTLSGTRYYTIGGVAIAARTSSGTIDYLIGDRQGTSTVAIDSSNLGITRRYYDPYGNPIGAAPATWPGNKGFVGGTTDTSTGLTNFGAREYQPATGQFISPDAIINAYDPQDLNAYAYATDNPSTLEDPTGLCAHPSDPDPSCYKTESGNPGFCAVNARLCNSEQNPPPCPRTLPGCPNYVAGNGGYMIPIVPAKPQPKPAHHKAANTTSPQCLLGGASRFDQIPGCTVATGVGATNPFSWRDIWRPTRFLINIPVTGTTLGFAAAAGSDCGWDSVNWQIFCYSDPFVQQFNHNRPVTFGSVTLSPWTEDYTDSFYSARHSGLQDWKAHETKHSDQWAILTPAFGLMYALESAKNGTGRNNIFEQWAGLCDGGYC